jgi:phage virion morphogenesis protein
MRIEVHDSEILAAFNALLAAGRDPKPYLEAIGATLAASAKLRFVAGRGPSGSPWKAVLRGGRPLRDTGTHLMNPLHHQVEGNAVVVGVPYAWARIHQFGGRISAKRSPYLRFKIGDRWASKKSVTIPARPFLGISASDHAEILDILRDKLIGISR